jgi:hypothetical protein
MASVLAHEYPQPWVQFLAYGTPATVSVTRVTGLEHFPADVAVGKYLATSLASTSFMRILASFVVVRRCGPIILIRKIARHAGAPGAIHLRQEEREAD